MWYLFIIAIAVIGVTNVNAACKVCNAYGYACINSNQFKMCEGGIMQDDQLLTCPTGTICSDLGRVCITATSGPPGCPDKCNVCQPTSKFACTSRTTYIICNGTEPTAGGGTCPTDTICDNSEPPNACVPDCGITNYVCDKLAPTPSTPSPPTASPPTVSPPTVSPPTQAPTPAPTPSVPTANQVCATQNTVGRFPYPNDNACIKYVYCRYVGSSLLGVDSSCVTNQYFNKDTQNCQLTKPSWCI